MHAFYICIYVSSLCFFKYNCYIIIISEHAMPNALEIVVVVELLLVEFLATMVVVVLLLMMMIVHGWGVVFAFQRSERERKRERVSLCVCAFFSP